MNPFYKLNETLANIGKDTQQVAESKKQEVKTPARKTLEESLRSDMKSLMEGAKPDFLDADKDGDKKEPMKKAMGDKKKNPFGNKKVKEDASAGMAQSNTLESEKADKDYDKDGKVESPKAEYMGARIAAGKRAAEKMKEQISPDAEMDEAGLPDVADKAKKMSIARGEKPSPLKNVGKGIKAFFKGEPEPMDEEQEMVNFLQSKLSKPQAKAKSYNKGTGHPDAHNGMEFEGEEMTLEAVSRKHFQQVADLLKAIEDPAKRKEMAMHHAQIFAQQNPRFDIVRFGQAAGVDLAECGMWESLKGGQKKLDVDGDGSIGGDDLAALRARKNEGLGGAVVGGVAGAALGGPMGAVRGAQAGNAIGDAMDEGEWTNPGLEKLAAKKRAERQGRQETDEGFEEMDAWLAQREKEKGTGKFDKRKVSTGTVYTRKPETFGDEPGAAPDANAPKRGRGRPKKMAEDGCCPHCGGPITPEGEIDEEAAEAGKRHFFDKLAPAAKKAAKVVKAVTGGRKEVDEESTDKEDKKAEKAGKKVAKDIEHDEGNKSKGDNKAEKAGKKVTKDIEADDKKDKKEKKDDKKDDKKEGNPFAKKDKKEEKVEETTTSGSVATASTSNKSNGMGIGQGVYESMNDQFERLLKLNESINVAQESSMMEDGNEEETVTITATGDDVHRFKELLANMGLGGQEQPMDQAVDSHDDACGTCGGVPCQCDDQMDGGEVIGLPGEVEIISADEVEEDITVSMNSPDYPSNQEYDNDALQYSGGLNKPKRTVAGDGQTTVPVTAVQIAEDQGFFSLVKAMIVK